jgi:oxygen-independent coproporphyrinogen-3 oxidase
VDYVTTARSPAEMHLALPRSVYVHVPFCDHRCGYCNFALVANRRRLIPKYLEAVRVELERLGDPTEIDTLYLGGGTPTQLKPDELRSLFQLLRASFPLAEDYECTIEANPNDIDKVTCEVLAEVGVNRISLGAQSFRDDKLATLDRQHAVVDTTGALMLVRSFAHVSLDLIFAAPGETLSQWQADLQRAIEWRPDHISTYGLTYEAGTAFHTALTKSKLMEVDDVTQRRMYEWTIDRLIADGFEHYEVSNFAVPGHRARHNQVYWTGQPFFGIGPGAASYVAGVRRTNDRSVPRFIDRTLAGEEAVIDVERLTSEDRARERLVFGLRRLEGIDRRRFHLETGYDLVRLGAGPLQRFVDQKLLQWRDERLALTRQGLLVSDSLWPELI